MVNQAADLAIAAKAKSVEIAAQRGATLLSNGKTLAESETIAAERATKVADLLRGLGTDAAAVKIRIVARRAEARWSFRPAKPDRDHSRHTVSISIGSTSGSSHERSLPLNNAAPIVSRKASDVPAYFCAGFFQRE